MTSSYWNDLKLARKGLVVALLPVTCLLLGFASVYGLTVAEWKQQRWIEHTLEVRHHIERALTGIVDGESAARGFGLTHNDKFQETAAVAREDVTNALANLAALIHDSPAQQKRLTAVRDLLQTRYQISEAIFATNSSATDAEVNNLVLKGRETTEAVRRALLEMETEEFQSMNFRMTRAGQLRDVNMVAVALTVAFGITAGFVALFLVSRSIVRRIQDIGENAQRLAAELPLLETTGGKDEIGRLNEQLKATNTLLSSRTRALRESEARLQAIVDNTNSVIFMKDVDSRFLMLNRQFEKLFKIKREAVIGRTAYQVFPKEYADVYRENDLKALATTEPVQIEETAPEADGIHTYLSTRVAMRDANGNPYAICGIFTDITERKRAEDVLRNSHSELERHVQRRTVELQEANTRLQKEATEHRETAESLKRTHAQLLQAQKMEALGQIAGGIAHDFNNILTTIIGHSMLLLQQLPEVEREQSSVAEILRASNRATSLSKQLLSFSRPQPSTPVALSLNRAVNDAEKMLTQGIGSRITFIKTLQQDLHNVKADLGQVEQLLLNLVINARDAIEGTGEIEVITKNVFLKPEEIKRDVATNEFVTLAVRDSGAGMAPELMAHVFEPFFTTKLPGQGTGLGLATCSAIVQENDGWISCQSQPGKGTTFTIFLPRFHAEAEEITRPNPDAELPRGRERLLVVEDEPAVGHLFETLLRRLGYDVLRAEHGEEAEKAFTQSDESPIDLVLTDLDMPRMDGTELVRRLAKRNQNLKIILTSGNGDNLRKKNGQGFDYEFIPKPFTFHTLAQKVREVLDRPAEETAMTH